MTRSCFPAVALLFFLFLISPVAAEEFLPRLSELDAWRLEALAPLLQEPELLALRRLDEGIERELFLRRFWQARGAGDALERWSRNLEAAARRFPHPGDERAGVLIAAGTPAGVETFEACDGLVRPLEVWTYTDWQISYQSGRPDQTGFQVLFFRANPLDPRTWRHWPRRAGVGRLINGAGTEPMWTAPQLAEWMRAHGCLGTRPERRASLERALASALDPFELRRHLTPPSVDLAWLDAATAELPVSPAEIDFPGRLNQSTLLHGRLRVPSALLGRNAEGALFDRLTIDGELTRGGRVADRFQMIHYLAGAPPEGEHVALDFYRRLTPGAYTLELRLADRRGLALGRETSEIEVPRLENEAKAPAGYAKGFGGLTRAEVAVLTTFPSLELLAPEEGLLVGPVSFEASTHGGPIDRVELRLDGGPAVSDLEPPYVATLDLGPEPAPHRVEAIALDPGGGVLARDQLDLNGSPPHLAVRILEPKPRQPASQLRVRVDVPAGERLAQVELFLDQERLAVLTEPPFSYPLPPIASGGGVHYARALATLESGEQREDTVILGSPGPIEEVDVRLVEVYASVSDAAGRPLTDLVQTDFRVIEDGEPQELARFSTVDDLPITVALLMDVSSSMRRGVEVASRSARRFFETVLRPGDQASLWTFNHAIDRAVGWTGDVELLRDGTLGWRPWGTTRLYDSLVYTLHGFGGLEGRRALVLLSDGQDVDSDFDFKQVRAALLEARVALYAIALSVEDPTTRAQLSELAEASGGRAFEIADVSGLGAVYRQIETELRSQYLLVYRSPERPERRGELRRVEVEVARRGARVRSLRGYYP